MTSPEMQAVIERIDAKNRRFVDSFGRGDMEAVAGDFYAPDARYLTGQLDLLVGRAAIAAFMRTVHVRIAGLAIHPYQTYGDPTPGGVVYQFCNTTQQLVNGEQGFGHYTAVFRWIHGDWWCELEAPAMGWIGGRTTA